MSRKYHRDRETSCTCFACGTMAPCSWCETDARVCEGCSRIFDRDDINEAGYCDPCEEDRIIAEALLGAQSAPGISPETLAIFGLED